MQMNDNAGSVRVLRQRLGMSQEKFAAEIGVSFSTVSRWENAHHEPSRPTERKPARPIEEGKRRRHACR